jgi:hypothetical protein
MPQWGALATGAQDGLDQYLKRLIAERQMQVQEQNADTNEGYRRDSSRIAEQNAESLAMQRKAAADEKLIKAQSRQRRDEWAKMTVAAGMPQITDDTKPEQRVALLNYYRAKHWAESGEELPDAVVTNLLTPRPVREDPNLLSGPAFEQRKALIAAQVAARATSGAGAAGARAQGKIDSTAALNNYLQSIVGKNPKLEDAMKVFQRPDVQADFNRKAGGNYTLPQIRAMLTSMYKDPQTLNQYMDAQALAAMRAQGAAAKEDDPENDWPGGI